MRALFFKQISRKLNVSSRTEAALKAQRLGCFNRSSGTNGRPGGPTQQVLGLEDR